MTENLLGDQVYKVSEHREGPESNNQRRGGESGRSENVCAIVPE